MKNLTSAQRDELIEQFVEIQVDNMDTQTLVEFVTDMLVNDYSNFNDDELKERINCYDDNDGLYEELVDNVTSLNDNEEPWLQPLFLSNLSQIGQEQVNGANILCVLIVNQSAKFITLVGQDYNALNVKN